MRIRHLAVGVGLAAVWVLAQTPGGLPVLGEAFSAAAVRGQASAHQLAQATGASVHEFRAADG
ncbi:MAG: hypothetical protein ACRD1E_08435, partial [Terriglobales bacterium]